MNRISTRITFVVLTALLIGGFPNFMIQEAQAGGVVSFKVAGSITTTANSVQACFLETDVNTSAALTTVTNWSIAGNALTGGTVTFLDGTCSGADGVTITSMTGTGLPLATDATPTIELADIDLQHGGANDQTTVINIALTDGAPPTFVSAETTSTTTIAITFSEDIVDNLEDDEFTINGVAGGSGISASDVVGAVLTLTTDGYSILSTETVTITYDGAASDLEDTVTLNDVADFGPSAVTNNVAAVVTSTSSNGSGCSDCEAPTLGLNSESKRIVENGFTYNGKSADVERFFTPYPLITATVGKQNTAVFKIYENMGPENVKHFAFAFGLDKSDIISNSKAMIELDIDHEGTETVTVTDPENALDNIKVSTNIGNCIEGEPNTQCLIVTINHMFRTPLDFNMVATDVWDMKRNSWQNYYNHGIEVIGESLNPAKIHDGINAGHIYHLTETSRTTAVDEFDNTWSLHNGKWMKDYVQNERVQDTSSVFNRMHSDFVEYKELQAQNAIPQLLESCPTCLDSYANFDDSFGHEYSNEINKLDNPEIIQKMILENERAQKIMNYLLDPLYYQKLSFNSNQ